jgi:hypothetical protein
MGSDKVQVRVIKSPLVPSGGNREEILENEYRDEVIYHVRLSNGLIVTRPDDFLNDVEEKGEEELTQTPPP